MDDLNILLKATLDINKSVDNINKQILQVQDKLKNVNISLNIDDFKNELEKAFGSIESKVKKTKENKLEFQGIKETAKQIKELSGSLENIYKDLKKVGDVKSLKNIYDTDGNVSGFNLQLEKTMGNLKEISNYNVFGQYNKETKEYEYALTKVNSTLKEIDNSNKKINDSNKKSSQMTNAKNLQAYYDNARKYVLEVEKGAMDATEALAKLESVMMKSDKSGFTWQFDGLSMQQQKAILSDRNMLENEILKSKKSQYDVEKQIEQSQDKQHANTIKHTATIKEMNSKLGSLQSKYSSSVDASELSRIKTMVAELEKLDPATKTYSARVTEANKAITALTRDSSDGFKKTQDAISDTTSKTSQLGLAMRTLGQLFMVGSPIFLAQQVFRDMATSVNEVNKALTDIRIVTGMSGSEALELRDSYNELGRTIGATTNEMLTGATAWFRQGKSIAETQDLITASITGAKLAGVESAQMSEYLTATLNGFQLSSEKAINVVDKMVAIDNAAATSVTELAVAMQQTSASAQMAGVSIDELLGYIGTVSSVTRRSAEVVGQSFKTIFSRYQNIKLGEFTEDGVASSDVITAMGNIGIKVKENEDTFREFGDVVQELSTKWETLTQVEQISIANAMAGVRQRESFLVLMNNMSEANKLTALSMDSAGLATDRFGIHLQGTEALLNKFRATTEAVFMKTLGSDTINNMIKLGIASLEFVESIGGLVPLLKTIISLFAVFRGDIIASFLTSMAKSVVGLGTSINILKVSLTGMIMQMKGVQTVTKMTAMTMQSMIPLIGLLATVVGGVGMAYSSNRQKMEEDSRQLQEKINKTHDEINSINKLVSTYDGLKEASRADKSVRDELINTQKEIVKLLEVEKDALDLVNGSYEDNIDVINRANQKKLEGQLSDVNIKYKEDSQALDDILSGYKNKSKTTMTLDLLDENELESYKKVIADLGEEFSDVFEGSFSKRFGGGVSFTEKITSESAEDMYDFLTTYKELMADAGLTGTQQYGDISKELEILKNAMDKVNESTEQYNSAQNTVLINSLKTKTGIHDLSTATNGQIDSLEKMYVSEKLASHGNMSYTKSQQVVAKAQYEFRNAMMDVNDEYAKYILESNKATTVTDVFASSLEEIDSNLDTLSGNIDTLNSAIDKMESGTGLTSDEIRNLIEKFPSLRNELTKTETGYSINEQALRDLKDETINYESQSITSHINSTKNALTQCQSRLKIYMFEIQGIKDLASAQKALEGAKSSKGNQLFGTSYRPVSYKEEFNSQETEVLDYVKNLEELYKRLDEVDIVKTGGTGDYSKKKSSSSSKKDNTISDAFKKDLAEISKLREEIETKIAELQEAINLDELLGEYDPDKANKMTDLLSQLKGIADIEMGKLNGLKKVYKQQEQLAEIESLMATARKQQFTDEMSYQQHMIDLINKKYDAEKRSYDDKVRDIELQQEFVKEGSEEHIALEQQKVDLLLQMQQSYLEKVRQLKESNLSQDQEDVRKYVDMYYDAEMEILNMQKSMAEKAKSAKLEAISKQVEQYEEQKKAQQDIFDMTMKMIRAEHEARKKALQDEVKGYEKIINKKKEALRDEYDKENAKDELDEKQKTLADIEKQLLMLEGVEGEDAKAKRIKLEEEKAKAIKDIDKFNREQLLQGQEDMLDKELENFKDKKEEEIQEIDDYLSKEGNLRDEAMKRIDKNGKKLYEQLKKYSSEYSTVGGEEFDKMWQTANKSIEGYTDKNLTLLDTMKLVTQELEKQKELHNATTNSSWQENVPSGNAGGSQTNKNVKVIQQMMANSNKWQGSDAKEKERLSAENAKLGNSIGAYYDSATGTWYTDKTKKTKLYDSIIGVYHKGGIVGGNTSLKSSEEFAKLLKGEVVASIPQIDNFMNKTLPRIANGCGGNYNINLSIDKLIDVDKLDNNVDIESITKRAIDGVMKNLNNGFRNKGLRPSW